MRQNDSRRRRQVHSDPRRHASHGNGGVAPRAAAARSRSSSARRVISGCSRSMRAALRPCSHIPSASPRRARAWRWRGPRSRRRPHAYASILKPPPPRVVMHPIDPQMDTEERVSPHPHLQGSIRRYPLSLLSLTSTCSIPNRRTVCSPARHIRRRQWCSKKTNYETGAPSPSK